MKKKAKIKIDFAFSSSNIFVIERSIIHDDMTQSHTHDGLKVHGIY